MAEEESVLEKFIGFRELSSMQLYRHILYEFCGTFLHIAIGSRSMATIENEPINVIQIALTFGFAYACLHSVMAKLNGCHLNPAVTIGFLVVGEISLIKALLYVIVQCAGCIIATFSMHATYPKHWFGRDNLKTFVTDFHEDLSIYDAIWLEYAITMVFVFLVKYFNDPQRQEVYRTLSSLYCGLGMILGHLSAFKITGAGMNPARTFGSAVATGHWKNHWVYWLSSLAGGAFGGLFNWVLGQIQEQEL